MKKPRQMALISYAPTIRLKTDIAVSALAGLNGTRVLIDFSSIGRVMLTSTDAEQLVTLILESVAACKAAEHLAKPKPNQEPS